jgi:hypothetical protein
MARAFIRKNQLKVYAYQPEQRKFRDTNPEPKQQGTGL